MQALVLGSALGDIQAKSPLESTAAQRSKQQNKAVPMLMLSVRNIRTPFFFSLVGTIFRHGFKPKSSIRLLSYMTKLLDF